MQFHEISNIYPLIEDEQFQELVDDIRKNGLQVPIVTFENQILDGRNRYRACIEAEIKPEFVGYDGSDPIQCVISLNSIRRHLSISQRALVAANIANLTQGGNRRSFQRANLHFESIAETAEKLNVSERSVKKAKQIKRDSIPEVVAQVEKGEMSLNEASKISKLPEEDQDNIAKLSPPERKKTLKEYNLDPEFELMIKNIQAGLSKEDSMFMRETLGAISKLANVVSNEGSADRFKRCFRSHHNQLIETSLRQSNEFISSIYKNWRNQRVQAVK